MSSGASLAIDGGRPVRRTGGWPGWPEVAPTAEEALRTVLHSGRWALSSPRREELAERRFARDFAAYVGARHCIPTDHGSSALTIALESLGIRYGRAVLVPALTWTATATAVLRAGLVPVLTDADPRTGCITADTLDLDVEPAAVLVVHWACRMADVPAIAARAATAGADVIEDAAQAHGARWLGRGAGSLGRLGCFSMQHSKVLTSGEGGAVVTGDDALAPRLEELRADSRRYRAEPVPGELELTESASVQGANYCLSEFAAALLSEQLTLLDGQHERRNRNHDLLQRLIAGIPGVRLPVRAAEQDRLSLYEVPLIFDPLPPDGNTWIADALTAELGVRAYPPRTPLHRSALLQPWTRPGLGPLAEEFVRLHRDRAFPGAEYLAAHAVLLHHSAFLGPARDMTDLAEAVAKVAAAISVTARAGADR